MSLLDQLWDDTVAGPRPENGLGKLRKQHTFTVRPSKESEGGGAEEGMRVTRSIMILKPPPTQNGSPPVSPAGSTPPVSPFAVLKEKKFADGCCLRREQRGIPVPEEVYIGCVRESKWDWTQEPNSS